MADAEITSSTLLFQMAGCRQILTYTAGSIHIENQVLLIEQSIATNPRMVFDVSKALLETVCKFILHDRGEPPDGSWDAQKLLRETTKRLQLVPDSHLDRPKVKESLTKAVNGLFTVIQALAELRNEEGIASHGPDPFAATLLEAHALMVARTADAIVHFLINAHHRFPSEAQKRRIEFRDNPDYNDYVDELHGTIEIFGNPYRPSEILCRIDEDAYRNELALYRADLAAQGAQAGEDPSPGADLSPTPATPAQEVTP